MKEITFPELHGVDDNGKAFGLAEFFTDILFTRPDLLRDADFCEMVEALQPSLMKLRGADQVGKPFRLSDEYQRRLLACDWTNPRVVHHSPENALWMAQFRLVVKRAIEVKEETAPKAEKSAAVKNGAAKKNAAEA